MQVWKQGIASAWQRLWPRSAWKLALLVWLWVVVMAGVLRVLAPALAWEWSLRGWAGWLLPLTAWGVLSLVRERRRLQDLAPDRGWLWLLGWWTTAAAAGVLISVLALAWMALIAGGVELQDALTTAWIGGLGLLAYAALFALASTWGRRGGAGLWALLLDFVFGSGEGVLALGFPRSHVRSLLGGEAVAELTQPRSSMALWGLALLFFAVTALRVRSSFTKA